jgi:hypothetical protein
VGFYDTSGKASLYITVEIQEHINNYRSSKVRFIILCTLPSSLCLTVSNLILGNRD